MNSRSTLLRLGCGLALLGATYAWQRPFRVYPSLEPYDNVPLPPDFLTNARRLAAGGQEPPVPRHASTVVLLRDGVPGLQADGGMTLLVLPPIFMVKPTFHTRFTFRYVRLHSLHITPAGGIRNWAETWSRSGSFLPREWGNIGNV